MLLNVGCGGRNLDKACGLGNVRIDVEKFEGVTCIMDAQNLAFKDHVFNGVFCFEVLEHLVSPFKAMCEFVRVCKPCASVFVSVPNVWYWRLIVRFSLRRKAMLSEDSHTDHKQAWDIREMRQLGYQAGLRLVDVRFCNWYDTGKLKLNLMDKLVSRLIPQCGFTHAVYVLKVINNEQA